MNAITESLKIMAKAIDREKTIINDVSDEVEEILRIKRSISITNCCVCMNEITDDNPGKIVKYFWEPSDRWVSETVCNACFADPEYQELIHRHKELRVINY